MKIIKKIIALTLIVVSILSCSAIAANAATSGNRDATYTMTVTTKANWWIPGGESITISQTKGTFKYSKTDFWGNETGKTGSGTAYGSWTVSARATDGSHYTSKSLGGKSVKLDLKPNKTYKVTIRYISVIDDGYATKYHKFHWTQRPQWRVSKTWKVSNYY